MGWGVVHDLHVTLLHKSDPKTGDILERLDNFKVGEEVVVKVKGILYTEKKNISLVVELDDKDVINIKKIHHITYSCFNSKPVDSNFFLAKAMEQDENFREGKLQSFSYIAMGDSQISHFIP